MDRITDEQKAQTNREDGQGGDLPDRLVNPEGYRLLSEPATQRGDQNTSDNTHPVYSYLWYCVVLLCTHSNLTVIM